MEKKDVALKVRYKGSSRTERVRIHNDKNTVTSVCSSILVHVKS